ncbi:electron transfer flavoprotein subunit beta [Plasmopara halstedii]|uniref:Electron transfer flavoprotein subunit alpha n=1 Tax=Plasmopara halstedii TaxID=4781 RepID=A0A0P1B5K0_PLAHL|nr:electron transfer flavoprotein subunit beta [Plasmopara halstedii]CEG49655.1 electron transfer flavoprotein subunit beta [Plasmopara halstedii]|eukprot:XP_024586024.1 electron transfer flavoprotein subunit beta [Plasmopara halstedii]
MISRQIIRRVATSRNAAMSTLVVAELNQSQISGPTLATVTAANKIGGDITMLVLGSQAGPAAEAAAKVAGVKNVLHAADPKYDHFVAEEVAELLIAAQKASNYSHVLAPSSNASKNYLPRAGAKLDTAPISDILAVIDKDTFLRPTYAGNAIAQIKSKEAVKLITVRPTGFEKAAAEGGNASVSPAPEAPTVGKSTFVSEEVSKSERPDLSSARVVVSGGRGLKSGENFEMLYKLADKLGGAVGASRAAVDAGFVPNELQVGQTGKVVAPELKTIVAINKDEEAPIFQVADYGLVDDLFKVVPELTEKI